MTSPRRQSWLLRQQARSVTGSEPHTQHSAFARRRWSDGGYRVRAVLAGTFIPFSSPTHAYIGLFTPAEMSSVAALAQGICWSFLFGGLSGSVFAWVYNVLASLDDR